MFINWVRKFILLGVCSSTILSAHCQMPCGIYDDQMIYDQVDEYYLTMVKAIGAITNNKFESIHDRNQYIRWVMTKETESNEIANILTTYFLQQKIKPDDEDSFDLVKSIHRLLFLLVAIKQNVDLKMVKEFGKEWDHFKDLFHPEQECRKVIGLEQNGGANMLPPHPQKKEEKPHTHSDGTTHTH